VYLDTGAQGLPAGRTGRHLPWPATWAYRPGWWRGIGSEGSGRSTARCTNRPWVWQFEASFLTSKASGW